MPFTQGLPVNLSAFLDMTAVSELGRALLAASDNGYNVVVGSTASHPILFRSYLTHPHMRNAQLNSDAAGRYQFLSRYWDAYRKQLGLLDFGPAAQDRWAIQLYRECRALDDILAGRLSTAVGKCASRWASFPGSPYGQHLNTMAFMQQAYTAAGGVYHG